MNMQMIPDDMLRMQKSMSVEGRTYKRVRNLKIKMQARCFSDVIDQALDALERESLKKQEEQKEKLQIN